MVHKLPSQSDHRLKRKKTSSQPQPQQQQLQDSKISAVAPPDLKKKMKKSGSIKQSPVSSPVRTPNYMKSTTSSDARKEQSQVSSPNSSVVRNVKLDSGKKGAKTLARMRSLTKNPSFKPFRKCSPVVLCEKFEARRATCSSTLKDCKFPAYLPLNHGGTEVEGTSAMKVCPYTYCSLNGHHRSPLPPLKCFLSAKRRMIKAQRGVKLGCLSPRRVNKKLSPKEEDADFFVEIFSKEMDDDEQIEKLDEMDWETGEHSVVYIDYGYECSDIEAKSEIVDDEFVKSDEVLADEVSLVSFNGELFNSDGFSSSGDGDSELDDIDDSTAFVEESQSLQNEDTVEETCELDDIGDSEESQSLRDEDAIEETGDLDDIGDSAASVEESQSLQNEDTIGETSELDDIGDSAEAQSLRNEDAIEETGDLDDIGDSTESQSLQNEDAIEETGDLDDIGDSAVEGSSSLQNEDAIEETGDLDHIADLVEGSSSLQNEDAFEQTGDAATNNVASNQTSTDNEEEIGNTECQDEILMEPNAPSIDECDSTIDRATAKCKNNPIDETDESYAFNPRGPNFLPLESDPESEKVDLKHQELDERRNTEEWMVDYALRQAVTKLGPSRKQKVALLVEAFEKVMPITKWELSSAFDHARPVQACM